MSIGNTKTNGNKGHNFPYQFSVLRLLGSILVAVQTTVGRRNKTDIDPAFTGTILTLTYAPTYIIGVYYNGQFLTEGVDYTVAGANITFLVAKVADLITVVYQY